MGGCEAAKDIADAIMPYFKDSDRDIVVSSVKRYKEQATMRPIRSWTSGMEQSAGRDGAGRELKERVAPETIVNSFAEKASQMMK